MLRYFRSVTLFVTLALLANGCGYPPAQTPDPTDSDAPSGPPSEAPTPAPTIAPSIQPTQPVASTTEVPTESPAQPTPTTVGTEPPPQTGIWRRVDGLVSPDAHVNAVVAVGSRFVAVGYYGDDSLPCEEQTVDGRAWTSSDGQQWTEWRPEALAGLSLTLAVNAAGTVYAFGSAYPPCAADSVRAAARSTDGMSWERLQPDFPDGIAIDSVGASGGTLIALGGDRSWTSADGAHWQRAGEVPFSYSWFDEIGSLGGTSIAFDNNATNPVSFSEDAGESWSRADFGPVYNLKFYDALTAHERIVAVASACCGLPSESPGVTLTSTNGEHWEASGPFHDVPLAVVGISNGYLAIGRTTWISRDGLDWRVGPRLPELDRTMEVTAVSADAGVLVINADVAWFAPSGAIALDRWTDTPRAPEMPAVGVRYPYEVFLHCGWDAIYFGLRTWMPDPPFLGEDAVNPPPGFGDADRGWLTLLRDNGLEYESRRGPKVTLRPSDEPVEWDGPCA